MTSSPLVVVVGNPKAASRTRTAGEAAAARIAALTGLDAEGTAVIELADLGPQLFDWSSAAVRAATETLAGATVAVIATPVYKATYTGLLKAFLDWFGQTGLDGVAAVPLMVGAAANHALAVETHLRPLLVEIGATVPTRGLYLLESELDALDEPLDRWATHAGPYLRRAVGGGSGS
ncbi:MAG: NAD(P)H-dependent oxidoreductase [Acidimicrobiales bacterium]|nr:NAD(P)H-dependent oxidoreductase [Acidimicrobiales bacterium]